SWGGKHRRKGAVDAQAGARHDAGLGPRVRKAEPLHAHLNIEIAGLGLVNKLKLIKGPADVTPPARYINAVSHCAEGTRRRRAANVRGKILYSSERSLTVRGDDVRRKGEVAHAVYREGIITPKNEGSGD